MKPANLRPVLRFRERAANQRRGKFGRRLFLWDGFGQIPATHLTLTRFPSPAARFHLCARTHLSLAPTPHTHTHPPAPISLSPSSPSTLPLPSVAYPSTLDSDPYHLLHTTEQTQTHPQHCLVSARADFKSHCLEACRVEPSGIARYKHSHLHTTATPSHPSPPSTHHVCLSVIAPADPRGRPSAHHPKTGDILPYHTLYHTTIGIPTRKLPRHEQPNYPTYHAYHHRHGPSFV